MSDIEDTIGWQVLTERLLDWEWLNDSDDVALAREINVVVEPRIAALEAEVERMKAEPPKYSTLYDTRLAAAEKVVAVAREILRTDRASAAELETLAPGLVDTALTDSLEDVLDAFDGRGPETGGGEG